MVQIAPAPMKEKKSNGLGSLGTLLGAGAGALIAGPGGYAAGASLGASLGGVAGGMLDKPQAPQQAPQGVGGAMERRLGSQDPNSSYEQMKQGLMIAQRQPPEIQQQTVPQLIGAMQRLQG